MSQTTTPSKDKINESTSTTGSPGDQDYDTKEQDRFLPIANISRIMKRALQNNAKISKEAKETMQECISEFVSFVTSEASDRCLQEKRKTINGEDIIYAMGALGFDNYIEPLRIYLQIYREHTKGDKTKRKDEEDEMY
jgi:nuclear transcription Y subunit beta